MKMFILHLNAIAGTLPRELSIASFEFFLHVICCCVTKPVGCTIMIIVIIMYFSVTVSHKLFYIIPPSHSYSLSLQWMSGVV